MKDQPQSDKSPEQLDLANRIRVWREAANLRKIDLARILEVEPTMVTKWEAATNRPRGDGLRHIAEACGVSMSIFWGRLPAEAN